MLQPEVQPEVTFKVRLAASLKVLGSKHDVKKLISLPKKQSLIVSNFPLRVFFCEK